MESIKLPNEILQLIVSHVPGDSELIALPASHITTKTLYACLFVSKAFHALSVEQLYRHCLFIDSSWRLRALVRSYESRTPVFGRSVDSITLRQNASQSLFLKPFSDDTIDELNVVFSLSQLFPKLSTSLKQLVIDMPLRSYYPDEAGSYDLRLTLRQAFLSLYAIEEFTSVRDELYLSTVTPDAEDPVWMKWTSLRCLALYNQALDDELWSQFDQMPNLKTIMLTRPDVDEGGGPYGRQWSRLVNIGKVNTWREHDREYHSLIAPGEDNPGLDDFGDTATIVRTLSARDEAQYRFDPIIDIICVDGQDPFTEDRNTARSQMVAAWQQEPTSRNWAAYDQRNTFNDPFVCQEWVKRNVLAGTLWTEFLDMAPPRIAGVPVLGEQHMELS